MIHIRPGRTDDLERIVDFQVRMAAETEGLQLDRATVTRGVRRVFQEPAVGRYWLAETDGEVAGCLLVLPEWSDWRNGTVLWVHSLYVRPPDRRRGVFRALFEHLRAIVQADDSLRGLRLYVEKNNASARRAYEALGMDGEHYLLYEWLK